MQSRASLAEQVGSLFGTVIAVFLVMAANECGSDAGVMVLLKSLGSLAQLPYYFFSVGTIGCAEGGAALGSPRRPLPLPTGRTPPTNPADGPRFK